MEPNQRLLKVLVGRLSARFIVLLAAALGAACAEGGALESGPITGSGGTSGGVAGAGGSAGVSGSGGNAGSSGGGASGSAGNGGSGGSSLDGGSDAATCQGVVCDQVPPSVCAGDDLQVFQTGICEGDGSCSYPSSTVTCPNGCSAGSCVGDPCLGVSCNSPPASVCSDAMNRTVYQSPGSCSGGNCTYTSVQAFCPFGCVADVCEGDPCAGVTCNAPPSNFCRDASHLVAHQSPGTCNSSGACTYTTTDVFCANGCGGSQCLNDPCAGVSCTTPPARNCKDANTARSYAGVGTCNGGACSYQETEINCPYGCVAGVCRDCQVDGNCPGGQWCQSGSCTPCSDSAHCGPSCTNCAASGLTCSAGSCVECTGSGLCGPGEYCESNVCTPCTTNARCGASCTACGSGTSCEGGSCTPCDTNSRCGPSCGPCGGGTPHCNGQGASSACVQCLTNAHCTSPNVCNGGTCGPPCPATLTSAFSDDFAAPSSTSWTNGSDVALTTSRWQVYTSAQHGVRITGGRLEITNKRGSSGVNHGQGYAYVKTGGTGSDYDNALYNPVLKSNASQEIVWSLNLRRDNPESTNGGFDCSSSSSQNDRTVGLAYVLATNSAAGLNASASSCNPDPTSSGYAVVVGGSNRVRLVRFANGLRNGALTELVASGTFTVSNYFSARVTYNTVTDQWRLEARSDGSSSFADPSAGSYSFSGTATDATYVNVPLEYSGPYFQTGCTGLCSSTYFARFDNVRVGLRCAP